MGLQSNLAKQFVSKSNWRQSEYDREWSAWIDDVSRLVTASARSLPSGELFAPQEWQILNTIHATARAARIANNMLGLRDALAKYRAAVKHFLGATQ